MTPSIHRTLIRLGSVRQLIQSECSIFISVITEFKQLKTKNNDDILSLTCVIVKEAYMSVFVGCDCEGEGGVTNYFVNLS